MKLSRVGMMVAITVLTACRDRGVKVVTEERGIVEMDQQVRLFASDDERFRNAKPSPVKEGWVPEMWVKKPGTEFRLLNYRFGASGVGEVWVSVATGTVKDNVNRWVKGQFGGVEMGDVEIGKLKKVKLAGVEGVWVEASGTYASGMGAAVKEGYGLAGVVAQMEGQIVTVKMVGPRELVEGAKAELERFAAELKWVK